MNDDNKLAHTNFNDIANNLSMHVSNKFLFRKDQIRIYSGTTFGPTTDWSSKNMRRIHFSDCNFNGTNLRSTGFTGSIFRKCNFINENLNFTIFDEGLFIDCTFNDCTFRGSSFCNCEFVNCTMNNIELDACFFTSAIFNGHVFNNCIISDIIWENAKFTQCTFDRVILQKLNFEFTYFGDVHFCETSIPFASLPFVFGGIDYISKTHDEVYVKTVHPDSQNQRLSRNEYLSLLPEIILFYNETTNYFPLANIYLGIGKVNEGINAIIDGVKFWFNLHNYKLMYYLCDLANIYHFSIADRKKVFLVVQQCNTQILQCGTWDEQNQWNIHYNKMRECLLNSQSVPYVTLEFVTSIEENDYIELAKFMQTVDQLLLPSNSYYSLEIRHNSPFDLLYTIFADQQTLFTFIVGMVSILGVCDQIYTNHLKDKIHNKKKQKLSQKEQDTINDMAKNITNINYNFYNCKIKNLDTDYLMRQSIGCVNPESSGNSQ